MRDQASAPLVARCYAVPLGMDGAREHDAVERRNPASNEKERAGASASAARGWLAFAAVVALAFGVRLAFLAQARDVALFHAPIVDARSYWDWSDRIVAGDWMGDQVFYQAPLYPYFLALTKLAVGADLGHVRLVQIAIGALACGVMTLAARRWMSPAAGVVCGVLLALYPPAIFFDALIQKANLGLLWMALLLLALARVKERGSSGRLAASGAVLALLMLTREETLLLVPVIGAWLLFELRALPWSGRLRGLGAFALALAAVLAPVAWRNWKVGGEFVVTTSQAGTNFYIGNGPQATGIYVPLRPGRSDTAYERTDAVELAQQASGRKLTPREVSSFWFDRAFDHIRAQPGAWLALVGHKLALLVNWYEVPDAEDQYFYERSSVILRVLGRVWHFGILLPLAVAGVALTWARRRELVALYAIVVTLAAGVLLFYLMARYRYPLVPPLLIFAAAAPLGAWSAWRARRTGALAVAGVLAALVALPANVTIFERDFQLAQSHHNAGVALFRQGQFAEAAREYRAALAIRADLGPTWGKLGEAHRQLGQGEEARRAFARAIELRPDDWRYPWQVGLTWLDEGDVQRAAESLRRSVALPGANAEAWKALAQAEQVLLHWSDAARGWRKALEIERGDVNAGIQLAFLLATCPDDALRNGNEALAIAQAIAQARPNEVGALDALAAALGELGRFDEAVATAKRGAELARGQKNGALAGALEMRASVYAQRRPYRMSAR